MGTIAVLLGVALIIANLFGQPNVLGIVIGVVLLLGGAQSVVRGQQERASFR